MSAEISTGKASNRHPLDWYVEQGWEWEQVAAKIGLKPEEEAGMIWDPCCGYGHSLSRLQGIGYKGRLFASDLVHNLSIEDFEDPNQLDYHFVDFLSDGTLLPPRGDFSIWMNPPFSYQDGILEAFCRKALRLASHRVVALAPLKWMSGGVNRGRFFRQDFPPQKTLHFTSRPSMPPGDKIHLMGARAYRGGVIDYVAVVWDVRNPTPPGETREIWLPLVGER